MYKILKFSILLCATLLTHSAYAIEVSNGQQYESFPETFMGKLGLTTGNKTTSLICTVFEIEAGNFEQIYINYTQQPTNIPDLTTSITIDPHRFQNHPYMSEIHAILMSDFLTITEDGALCAERLQSIATLFNNQIQILAQSTPAPTKTSLKIASNLAAELYTTGNDTITELRTRFKEMLCHIALTRTYIKEAKQYIAILNQNIENAKAPSLSAEKILTTKKETQEKANRAILGFRQNIREAETLLRSLYPKPTQFGITFISAIAKSDIVTTFCDTRSEAEKKRETLTGSRNLMAYEIPYATMAPTENEAEDQIINWNKAFITNMLKPSIALDEAMASTENRIVFHMPEPAVSTTADAKDGSPTGNGTGDKETEGK